MGPCIDNVANRAIALSNEIGRRKGQRPLVLMDYF